MIFTLEFIKKQLDAGPPPAPSNARSFTPLTEHGFVIKTRNVHRQHKVFINCCCHKVIEQPAHTPEDPRTLASTRNLQIPLAVGAAFRPVEDSEGGTTQAIDVVVHPWVGQRCAFDSAFKQDVMHLAMSWVQQEQHVTLEKPGKIIRSKYKGGKGSGAQVTAEPFVIPEQVVESVAEKTEKKVKPSSSPANPNPISVSMDNPASLLKEIANIKNNHKTSEEGTEGLTIHTEEKPVQKKPLIQVIGEDSTESPKKKKKQPLIQVVGKDSAASPKKKNKQPSSVKKGFLNRKTSKPLYPHGSDEGQPASAYVNLMSRSQVVDLSKESPEEADRMMKAHAMSSKPTPNNKTTVKPPEDDLEFDQLCMDAEPELYHKSSRENVAMNDQFSRLAEIMKSSGL